MRKTQIPAGADEGWVTVFVRTLKQELGKTSLGKRIGVRVWWDENNVDRTDDIQKQIIATLPHVRVMVVLLSPAYMESDPCREERDTFLSAMRGRPLGDKRVFLIDLGKVDHKACPEPFRGPLGFKFHDPDGMKFGHPLPNALWREHKPYFDAVPTIAEKIAQRIGELQPPGNDQPPPPPPIATVYLAETTEDLDDQRREVAADLKQHGVRVVPEKRLSSELDECRQQVRKLADDFKPQVFVQLLDAKLGKAFDESDETLVTLQYQIALEFGMTVLQWRSRDIDVKKVSLNRLKTLLANPNVYTDPLKPLRREIRRKAIPSTPKQKSEPDLLPSDKNNRLRLGLVQCDTADLSYAQQLSELLKKRWNLHSWWPKNSDDPKQQADYREILQAWFDDCDAVVFLHCKADASKIEVHVAILEK